MSATFIGADIEQLNAMATNLDQTQVGIIDGVITAVQAEISSLDTKWRGNDATQFAGNWDSTHRPALQAAITALQTAGESARSNATNQTKTSATF